MNPTAREFSGLLGAVYVYWDQLSEQPYAYAPKCLLIVVELLNLFKSDCFVKFSELSRIAGELLQKLDTKAVLVALHHCNEITGGIDDEGTLYLQLPILDFDYSEALASSTLSEQETAPWILMRMLELLNALYTLQLLEEQKSRADQDMEGLCRDALVHGNEKEIEFLRFMEKEVIPAKVYAFLIEEATTRIATLKNNAL